MTRRIARSIQVAGAFSNRGASPKQPSRTTAKKGRHFTPTPIATLCIKPLGSPVAQGQRLLHLAYNLSVNPEEADSRVRETLVER